MMNQDEVLDFFDEHPAVFYRVFATSTSPVAEYRFPGLSFTGYFVESAQRIIAWIDILNIERIEVW